MQIDTFLARWRNAGGSERANYQLFIADLCALLEVVPPQPASEDTRDNAYVFERRVVFHHGDGSTSNGFIDCYRRAALNAERAREEAAGHIRWLRPDFQNPSAVPQGDFVPGAGAPQKRPAGSALGVKARMDLPEKTPSTLGPAVASMVATATERRPWPATLPEQVAAIAQTLVDSATALRKTEIADRFTGKGSWKKRLPQLLETLVALGRARVSSNGRYGTHK
jgi:hypothetical protein